MNKFLHKRITPIWIPFVFLFLGINLYSQVSLRPTRAVKGETHALVIGIKDYQDEKIRDLRYADKDAREFLKFLRSENGGNVPEENITLLLNEDATISNIYAAFRTVQEKVKKEDRLYFYFSGHGDVETSIYELGFLIAHDTPNKNYLNNAIRIQDINMLANTLSINKDVEVILITDACHSGKLAGSDFGKSLVGEQLAKVQDKEIRITSCKASEKSWEDRAWGGGRGAFSFHLINGLNGAADNISEDGIITLFELDVYLKTNVRKEVKFIKNEDQNPVVKGENSNAHLTIIKNEASPTETRPEDRDQSDSDGSRSMSSNTDRLLGPFKNVYFENLKGDDDALYQLTKKPANEILNWLKENYQISDDYYHYNETDEENLAFAKLALASKLHNIIQQQINYYLAGDAQELKKRQYYFTIQEDQYHKYIYMLDIALQMLEVEDPLHHIIQVKRNYFFGLIQRLKILRAVDKEYLRQLALQSQLKAYQLDPNAPYVNNELGILLQNNDPKKAEEYFKKAIELAPSWSFPYSNLANLYYEQGKYNEALESAKKAIGLNEDVFLSHFSLGRIYLENKNLLQAEEYLMNANSLDTQQALVYYYLGHVFSELSEFDEAENYYYLGEKTSLTIPYEEMKTTVYNMFPSPNNYPSIQPSYERFYGDLDSMNFLQCFQRGMMYYNNLNYNAASKTFYRCALLEPDDALVTNYLGRSNYYINNFLEAEYYLETSKKQYKNYNSEDLYQKYLVKYDTVGYSPLIYSITEYNNQDIPNYLSKIYQDLQRDEEYVQLCKEQLENKREYFYHLLSSHYIANQQYEKAKELVENYSWSSEKIKMLRKLEILEKIDARSNNIIDQYQTLSHLLLMEHSNLFESSMEDSNDSEGIIGYFDPSYQHKAPGKNYINEFKIKDPANRGIECFLEMKNLDNTDEIIQAEIHLTVAELYIATDQKDKAAHHLYLAKELSDHKASFVEKFIAFGNENFKYTDVLNEMLYLDSLRLLHVNQLPFYVDYLSRYGDYEKSSKMIRKYNKITLNKSDTLQFNRFQNAYYKKDYVQSKELIEQMIESNRMQTHIADYWLARIAIKQNNESSAYIHLESAINNGFQYPLVMKYDENFEKIREDEKYQLLISKVISKMPSDN